MVWISSPRESLSCSAERCVNAGLWICYSSLEWLCSVAQPCCSFSADVNQSSSTAFAPLSHTPAYSISHSLAPQGSHLSNLTCPQGLCKVRWGLARVPIKAQLPEAELQWSGAVVILVPGPGLDAHISHFLEQAGQVLLSVSPLGPGGANHSTGERRYEQYKGRQSPCTRTVTSAGFLVDSNLQHDSGYCRESFKITSFACQHVGWLPKVGGGDLLWVFCMCS